MPWLMVALTGEPNAPVRWGRETGSSLPVQSAGCALSPGKPCWWRRIWLMGFNAWLSRLGASLPSMSVSVWQTWSAITLCWCSTPILCDTGTTYEFAHEVLDPKPMSTLPSGPRHSNRLVSEWLTVWQIAWGDPQNCNHRSKSCLSRRCRITGEASKASIQEIRIFCYYARIEPTKDLC